MDKKEFRKFVRGIAAGYSQAYRLQASSEIMGKVEKLPEFRNASRILLYWSLPDEVRTHDFIEKWCGCKHFYLPSIRGEVLDIKRFEKKDSMILGKDFGILEPDGEAVPLSDMELVIVPGIAFDRMNNRLGRGRGYYDRLLAGHTDSVNAIGVAFRYQIFEALPLEEHDIRMSKVITDE